MDDLTKILLGLPVTLLVGLISFFMLEAMRPNYSFFVNLHLNAERLSTLMDPLRRRMMNLPRGMADTWAEEVRSLQEEVNEFQKQYQSFQSWKHGPFFSWPWTRCRIAQRAVLLLERVERQDKVNVDAQRGTLPPAIQERDDVGKVLGQEELLDDALSYLQVPTTRIIGIYGAGGIGKTTLLNQINNYLASELDQSSSNNTNSIAIRDYKLDHVIWATVSKDINLNKLQEDIAQRLGFSIPSNHSFKKQADTIRNYMKDKSFLLLLDDLWEPLKLEELGIPNPQAGGSQILRKVVFTTRFEAVCDSMQAMDMEKVRIKVTCLSKENAWKLFKRMLGKFNDLDRELCSLAYAIVEQCAGLPLALKVIGATMSSKRSLEDWEDALESLKKSETIRGTAEGIFRVLKHSYDFLNDDRMRECFLCCALWTEGHYIHKDELIQCWMGLGLLDRHHVDDKYRVGRAYLQDLKAACLVEAIGDEDHYVRMHDVIRDMALQIASENHKWLVQAGVGLKEAPRNMEQWREVERASLMTNQITTFPMFERKEGFLGQALVFPKLSTLILQGNDKLQKIPNSFFPCMPNLTYLDLSQNLDLKELPREICDLTELQYLNLSRTGISSLPQELGRLEKLRYLFLSHTCSLTSQLTPKVMPRGLQVLDLWCSSVDWEAGGEEIFGELKRLELLVGIQVRSTRMLQMLSKLSHAQLRRIMMDGIDGPTSLNIHGIFGDSQHMMNHCQELNICNISNLKELKVDFGEEGGHGMPWKFQKLESLSLESLGELEKIIWRGVEANDFLPRLRKLWIYECTKLENVSWVLQLHCLEFLSVFMCHGMKMLIDENGIKEGTADVAFPRLKRLTLMELTNLQGIYSGGGLAFPSLERINVYNCPKLCSLPFRWPLTSSKMKKIQGSQQWWDSLWWEDQRIRTSLHAHLMVLEETDEVNQEEEEEMDEESEEEEEQMDEDVQEEEEEEEEEEETDGEIQEEDEEMYEEIQEEALKEFPKQLIHAEC